MRMELQVLTHSGPTLWSFNGKAEGAERKRRTLNGEEDKNKQRDMDIEGEERKQVEGERQRAASRTGGALIEAPISSGGIGCENSDKNLCLWGLMF